MFDAKEMEAASDSWLYLYFPPGTTHTVTTPGSVTTNEGTQYELANAELTVGIRTVEMPNYGMKTEIEYGPLNETTYLILNYEPSSSPESTNSRLTFDCNFGSRDCCFFTCP